MQNNSCSVGHNTTVAANSRSSSITPSKQTTRASSATSTTQQQQQKHHQNEQIKDFYNINHALDYTCARLNLAAGQKAEYLYCGQCDTCQIKAQINSCKQWFTRASHLTIKNFILELIKSIQVMSIYNYLNNLLKISIDCKDYIYSRNKLIPSIKDDQLVISNDRCLNINSIDETINNILNWYKNSNHYIKLNFMISLLKECEQSIIYVAILQVKTIIEAPRTLSAFMNDGDYCDGRVGGGGNSNVSSNNTQSQNRSVSVKFTPQSDGNLTLRSVEYNNSSNKFNTRNERITITATSDYDDDIVNDNECTTDDDSINGEFDLSALYANVRINRKAKHVDFIRQLPVHLSKKILNLLSKKQLYTCLFVSKFWYNIVKEARKNANLNQMLLDDMMLLRGTTSKICNPKYANDTDVKVPNLVSGTHQVILNENEEQTPQKTKADFNWANAYQGVQTRLVIMEERNVFCGSYNVLLLKEKRDSHRVVSLNGKNLVALGSFDKKIRFIDMKTAEEMPMTIQGHAGSIKCIHICESRNIVFTGSYDTSIRCWSLTTGKCLRIFQGHQNTVTCIAFCEGSERLVSGSHDKTCRIWQLKTRVNQRVFKHKYGISSVAIAHEDMCISGGYKGKVKVFQITTGQLIKTISVHTGIVTGIKFDKWHIVTCSTDGYALAFSAQGNHKKCLMAMRHPKAVLCIEFQYLRAITGAADGKIRIWNILNGDCLRVMRGNSQCDPVLSLSVSYNRMLINTEFNVILMEFEPVLFEYGGKRELDSENLMLSSRSNATNNKRSKSKHSYTHIRASRMEVVGTPNVKLFNDDRKSVLSHSSGPISTKTLNEAKQIQQPRSVMSNSKLSIVTVNTPMSFNTLTSSTYQRSMLSYVNVQSEINLNPAKQSETNADSNNEIVSKEDSGIKLDLQTIDQDEANILRYKKLTLDETKLLLRNQLRNMRKSASVINNRTKINNTPTSSNSNAAVNTDNKKLDTKSCLETALINRNQNYYDLEQKKPKSLQKRPTSSPGYYDTKTKLKLTSDEFQQFLSVKNDADDSANEKSNIKDAFRAMTATTNLSLKTADTSITTSTNKSKPIVVKSAVTKLFETHEFNLKTNSGMYPPNVATKIPQPKVVSVIRPSSVLGLSFTPQKNEFRDPASDSDSNIITSNQTPRSQTSQNNLDRPRAQTAIERRRPPLNPQIIQQQRQKRVQIKTNEVIENFETNKLVAGDNLKLMTHKEVDEIMNRINVIFDMSQIKKQKEEEKTYRKLWLLKSTGIYHGSLLAKQKSFAPEIRE